MATSSAGTHEPYYEKLSPATLDIHRALASLMDELEAIDWYRQRIEACGDEQLKGILVHNMIEEIEHAAMVLEWLRRLVPKMNESLKTYLFTKGEITKLEEAVTAQEAEGQEGRTNCRPRARHDRRSQREASMTEHTSVAAPLGAELWKTIEEAAISAAREVLSARRILNVEGPHGLGLTTVETGKEEFPHHRVKTEQRP